MRVPDTFSTVFMFYRNEISKNNFTSEHVNDVSLGNIAIKNCILFQNGKPKMTAKSSQI